jgi:hypothetical protein
MPILPFTKEAYTLFTTPIKGVELKRFLNLDFFISIATALGRSLTDDELRLFIDFEEVDPNGNPKMFKCDCCGAGFVAVRWMLPVKKFMERLVFTRDLQKTLGEIELPVFGCFYLKKDALLDQPVAVCGAAFPGYSKNEGRYQKSCLWDMHETTNLWGMPLSVVAKKQQEIRDEIETKAEAARRAEEAKAQADLEIRKREADVQHKLQEETRRLEAERTKQELERKERAKKLAALIA